MTPIFDAHCHLCSENFLSGLDALAQAGRPENSGGFSLLACSENFADWRALYEAIKDSCGALAANSCAVAMAIGYHPRFLSGKENFDLLKNSVAEFSCAAVGEIGLDYACQIPVKIQKDAFLKQLQIAFQTGLPVVLHVVKAHADAVEILKNFKRARGGLPKLLLHAAKCSAELAKEYARMGAKFSFGERELSSARGAALAAQLDISSICLESDANGFYPDKILRAAEILASIRKKSTVKEVLETSYLNAANFL